MLLLELWRKYQTNHQGAINMIIIFWWFLQALLALILKNVDPELQVSIHVPVLSIRSDRRQETLSMPKHISVKNQNWTIIFGDVFCFSLSSVQPKKNWWPRFSPTKLQETIIRRLYHSAQRSYLWPWLFIVPLYHASPMFLYCRIQQTVIRSSYKPGNIFKQ